MQRISLDNNVIITQTEVTYKNLVAMRIKIEWKKINFVQTSHILNNIYFPDSA